MSAACGAAGAFWCRTNCPPACLEASLRLAEQVGARVLFNPAPAQVFPEALLRACFAVTPNREEARRMAGFAPGCGVSDDELRRGLARAGARRAAVTLGGEGVLLADERGCRRIPAFSAGPAADTTGAGDVFNGSLAAGLALGWELDRAARYAAAAAGISVDAVRDGGQLPDARRGSGAGGGVSCLTELHNGTFQKSEGLTWKSLWNS